MPGSVGVGDNTIIITSEDVGCFQIGVVLEKLAREIARVGFVESSLKSSADYFSRSMPFQYEHALHFMCLIIAMCLFSVKQIIQTTWQFRYS